MGGLLRTKSWVSVPKMEKTSWGWAVPSSVKLEVIVEVVVKVSSWVVGGWLAGEVENITISAFNFQL